MDELAKAHKKYKIYQAVTKRKLHKLATNLGAVLYERMMDRYRSPSDMAQQTDCPYTTIMQVLGSPSRASLEDIHSFCRALQFDILKIVLTDTTIPKSSYSYKCKNIRATKNNI